MRIDMFHHFDPVPPDPRLDQILDAVVNLKALTKEKFMAVSAAIQAFSDQVNVATDEIAKDLKDLRDKIAAGTPLTPEDQALLDAHVARLTAMGKDPENPDPVSASAKRRSGASSGS